MNIGVSFANLVDARAAAIVVGGTLLATGLQCGRADCAAALAALGRLARSRRFDAPAIRARLAPDVAALRRDGILRVDLPRLGDGEIDAATAALMEGRSLTALTTVHEGQRARRIARNTQATRTLVHAAELAPIFGLAGTLLSLSQLAPAGIAAAVLPQAIGMAVLTTFYGLLLANLVLAPLARAVDRRDEGELHARQQVIDWLCEQLADSLAPEPAPAAAPPGVHRLKVPRGEGRGQGTSRVPASSQAGEHAA